MRLQTTVFPNIACAEKGVYYQCDKALDPMKNGWEMPEKEHVSFLSYMNAFDYKTWNKYTGIDKVVFKASISGAGDIYLKCLNDTETVIVEKKAFSETGTDAAHIEIEMNYEACGGICYVEIFSHSKITIHDMWYETLKKQKREQRVNIALNICTYHRTKEVLRNLEQIKNSLFFRRGNQLYKKLSVMIVDNGSEHKKIRRRRIRLVHNENCGGSGGFKRGLEEIRKMHQITHVVFMDDDVEFVNESLYRLYALLSHLKAEYQHESVAGRMFRTDERWIQYTASEIWNKGDLRHIGLNVDMSIQDNICEMNENANGEYGGWWFCCYPMSFAQKNDPQPFFIHCDDVEYGLRHGGTPIILNGIQVWHETYEYRQSPVIRYYDTRNPLFVNELMGYEVNYEELLEQWDRNIVQARDNGDYELEFYLIQGIADYLKGMNWLNGLDSQKYSECLMNQEISKDNNAKLWHKIKEKSSKRS